MKTHFLMCAVEVQKVFKTVLGVCVVSGFLLLSSTPSAMASFIVNDWTTTQWSSFLAGAADVSGYLNTNLPNNGKGYYYVTHDMTNQNNGLVYVGPGYSYQNIFDAEAMYFTNDATNAYIAIVTGFPQAGYTYSGDGNYYTTGDIALAVGQDANPNNIIYDYGIDTYSTTGTSDIYSVTKWTNPNDFPQSGPFLMSNFSGGKTIPFTYTSYANQQNVLEATIPLGDLGININNFTSPVPVDINWTMSCGNSDLHLDAEVVPVPEPASMYLLGIGLMGLMSVMKLKKSKII
jgi:hypothetical protein